MGLHEIESLKNILLTIATLLASILSLNQLSQEKIPTFGVISTSSILSENTIIQSIDSFQDIYFKQNGRYWQGYWTHITPPILPSILSNTILPSNESLGWSSLININLAIPFSIRVANLESTCKEIFCWGYQIQFRKNINGQIFEKGIGRGININENTYDWKPIVISTPPNL